MSLRLVSFLHRGLFLIGFLIGLPRIHAETAAQYGHDFDDALALAEAGDFAGSEQIFFQGRPLAGQSIQQRVESATQSIHLSLALQNLNQAGPAASMATRALAILNDSLAPRFAHAPAVDRSKVYELAGFIYERLLPDPASAKIAYGQALAENPASKSAQAAANRLADAEAKATRLQAQRRR